MNTWWDQNKDPGYDFLNPGPEDNPGTEGYTQVVWKSTERLGCGVKGSYMVCRYEPAGNIPGEYEENVLPTAR